MLHLPETDRVYTVYAVPTAKILAMLERAGAQISPNQQGQLAALLEAEHCAVKVWTYQPILTITTCHMELELPYTRMEVQQ